MSQETIKKEQEKIQAVLDDANKKMVEMEKKLEEKVAKVEQMTRESPGTALTLAFLAGLTIGGIIALAASKK
jgi:ElaB/YqjD/DUF883 family membrane-anchored ribosome-binding protein